MPFLSFLKGFFRNLFLLYSRPRKSILLGEFQSIEVTFKGTLLLLLKGVQADLTLSPEVISYGSSPWVMLSTRFFDLNMVCNSSLPAE